MTTNRAIQLHERAISFLEMIEQNRNRRIDSIFKLNRYQIGHYLDNVRLFNTESSILSTIKQTERLHIKLLSTYNDILSRLAKNVFTMPIVEFENAEGAESSEELKHL